MTRAGLFITTVLASGIGAFWASYLKRRGENWATHADIDKLLEQVSAVTTATKTIEARVSNQLWQYQTARNDKKEAYIQVLGILGRMRHAVEVLRRGPLEQDAKALSAKFDELREEFHTIVPYTFVALNASAVAAYEAYERGATRASKLGPTPERWGLEVEAIDRATQVLIEDARADLGF